MLRSRSIIIFILLLLCNGCDPALPPEKNNTEFIELVNKTNQNLRILIIYKYDKTSELSAAYLGFEQGAAIPIRVNHIPYDIPKWLLGRRNIKIELHSIIILNDIDEKNTIKSFSTSIDDYGKIKITQYNIDRLKDEMKILYYYTKNDIFDFIKSSLSPELATCLLIDNKGELHIQSKDGMHSNRRYDICGDQNATLNSGYFNNFFDKK